MASLTAQPGEPVPAQRTRAVQLALGMHPGAFQPVSADAAIIVLLYTLAAYRPRRISLSGLSACLIGIAVAAIRYAPSHGDENLHAMLVGALVLGVPTVSAWVLGDSMAYRRAHYAWLEERAIRAEAERDAQSRIAAAEERARIARELHDVIAHNLSVMVAQADGGRYAFDAAPQKARQALAEIGGTGRQAVTEMSHLLGVLRAGDQTTPLAPAPGLPEIAGLVARRARPACASPRRCTGPRGRYPAACRSLRTGSCRRRSPTSASMPAPARRRG